MVKGKVCSLIINEGNCANDVPLSRVNLPTSAYEFSELHEPQKGPEHSDFFRTFSEPLLRPHTMSINPLKSGFSMFKRNQNVPCKIIP